MSDTDQSLLRLKHELTPTEYANFQKRLGPISWWEKGRFWLITSHQLGQQALKASELSADRSAFFISRMPNLDLGLVKDFFAVVAKMMVMSDDQEHKLRRKIAVSSFHKWQTQALDKTIAGTINDLLDDLPPGEFDFVKAIAEPLPSRILAELFAIPEQKRSDFYRWANNMTQFFGGASAYRNVDGIEVNDSASSLRRYFRELIAERRKEPANDFLSLMIAMQATMGISDDELVSQAIMMLVAGQVTTTDQLCNNLYLMLTTPGVWQRMANDPDSIPAHIEECHRLDPAVTYLFRVARSDLKIGDQRIARGETVFIANHAINRDPVVFADHDTFRADRPNRMHFAFGHGNHFCLGAASARKIMHQVYLQLVKRWPSLEISEQALIKRKHHSLAFSGFETLTLLRHETPMIRSNYEHLVATTL